MKEIHNKIDKFNNKKLYQISYWSIVDTFMREAMSKINSLKEYDLLQDKASRLANKNTIQCLNNWNRKQDFVKGVKQMADIGFFNKLEDLEFDIEELTNNKYFIKVFHKHQNVFIDAIELYAPNYETAKERVIERLKYMSLGE